MLEAINWITVAEISLGVMGGIGGNFIVVYTFVKVYRLLND